MQLDMFDLSKDHKLTRKDELERVKNAGATIHSELMGGRLSASTKDFTNEQLKAMKLGLNMTRAMGHLILHKYGVSPDPEFSFMFVQTGDVVICATDGLWEVVTSDDDVADRVFIQQNAERLSKDLCKLSDSRFIERKLAADNVTITVIQFLSQS
jgi:serine/threonine protein phosphatase PrpC